MKKLLISLALLVSAAASHADFVRQSFLTGNNVYVTNGATVYFQDTNVLYTAKNGAIVLSLTNGANTNITWGGWGNVVKPWSDRNGNVKTDLSVYFVLGDTNMIPTTNQSRQIPIPITGIVYPATLYGTAVTAIANTNFVTFVFRASSDGSNFWNQPTGVGVWTVTTPYLSTTTNRVVFATNPPSTFLSVAAGGIKLYSIQCNTNTAIGPSGVGAGQIITDVGLGGFAPSGQN